MSANENLQPEQLAMFMPAGTLRTYDSVDRQADKQTINELWTKKLRESKKPGDPHTLDMTVGHGAGVYDSVKAEGVKTPVNVSYRKERGARIPTMGNGNHRVAAQADINPDALVPVLHHDNLSDATKGGYEPATKRAESAKGEAKRKAEWAKRRPLGTSTNEAIDRLSEVL